jgi:molybdate transport system regulatory protein
MATRKPPRKSAATGARYPGLTLRILGPRFPAMGPGKADLVEAIHRSGSISAAARELGMSYRRAWQLADALNRSFTEPVIARAVGGASGGGASVTAFGLALVQRFRAMEATASAAIAADLRFYQRKLRKPGKA